MSEPKNQAQHGRRKGYYARQVEAEAARQGLTVEEYGVYKGDVGSAVKPISSAGGLLFISILITVIMAVAATLIVKLFVDGTEEPNWGQIVFAAAFGLWIVPTTWTYYFKERKAVRLRKAAGKTLRPPTRRSSQTDW
ncbi:hypothetical protein [Arthrobacter sp. W4I7]|uniref:hypothetical protein n=1 Tax=Arthrobacter sp. W4I7 TaxID=3042296 RepID=UPI002783257E|nr:hypothetical protein [Arthrobacter sp. W4I7]MDQ0690062.1 hypothetical protein [Arthrobacter sp. W4I7]